MDDETTDNLNLNQGCKVRVNYHVITIWPRDPVFQVHDKVLGDLWQRCLQSNQCAPASGKHLSLGLICSAWRGDLYQSADLKETGWKSGPSATFASKLPVN